jgi:serine/threonine protein kinase
MTSEKTAQTRLDKLIDPNKTLNYGAAAMSGTPVIPDVVVEAEIGRGGMGVVFRGRQTYLDRPVAIKLLLVDKADEAYVKRFQREAKILAGLAHPHIVSCYSAGLTQEQHPYLVMEFIDGPNLKAWVEEHGIISEVQALRIIHDLALALQHAHKHDIIHRDVKPENVLLAKKINADANDPFPFVVKLVDLGLARPGKSEGDMQLTVAGTIMGTPTTMAPEQFDDPDGVDYRADMYGLGCILYFILTATPAFNGRTTAQLITQKMTGPIPDPRQVNPNLSRAAGALVQQLLHKERTKRPADYDALLAMCQGNAAARSNATGLLPWIIGGTVAVMGLLIFGFLVTRSNEAKPVLAPVAAPATPVAEIKTTPEKSPQKAAELSAPTSLWENDLTQRLRAWTFADEPGYAQWQSSETHDNGIAGIRGRISRPLPNAPWELSCTARLSNYAEAKTDSFVFGLILNDHTRFFIKIRSASAAIISLERTFANGEDPPEQMHIRQDGLDKEHNLTLRYADGFITATINNVPYAQPIGLSGVPKDVYLEAKGKAPVEVHALTIRQ